MMHTWGDRDPRAKGIMMVLLDAFPVRPDYAYLKRLRQLGDVSQRWQRPLCDFMVQLDGPTEQSRLVEVRVLASTGLVLVVRGV